MTLSSPAFKNGDTIPKRYTCEGKNISPPLQWQNPPAATQALVLIVSDADAPMGVWDHWLLYNIPVKISQIAAAQTPPGASVGFNSWQHRFYEGPCPPHGMHRYIFTLYALNQPVAASRDKTALLQAMHGHILARASWLGRYTKSR